MEVGRFRRMGILREDGLQINTSRLFGNFVLSNGIVHKGSVSNGGDQEFCGEKKRAKKMQTILEMESSMCRSTSFASLTPARTAGILDQSRGPHLTPVWVEFLIKLQAWIFARGSYKLFDSVYPLHLTKYWSPFLT